MFEKISGQIAQRCLIYFLGLLIMALGAVILIKSNMGATPWDVLHVGLYYHLGHSIGTWSIIVGILILAASAVISLQIPHLGAFINMVIVGFLIDFYMELPFIITPHSFLGKFIMFLAGILLLAYGTGLYIAARFGAGPRDSLMIAVTNKTGWKIRNVRGTIEIIALLIGWGLGGPANWGTILYCSLIGPLCGLSLPQMDKLTILLLQIWKKGHKTNYTKDFNITKRGVS